MRQHNQDLHDVAVIGGFRGGNQHCLCRCRLATSPTPELRSFHIHGYLCRHCNNRVGIVLVLVMALSIIAVVSASRQYCPCRCSLAASPISRCPCHCSKRDLYRISFLFCRPCDQRPLWGLWENSLCFNRESRKAEMKATNLAARQNKFFLPFSLS